MTWNLDQIERELKEGGEHTSLAEWRLEKLRLPGALIRHLLGERTEEHGDLWDRAVGAVTRAEAVKDRHFVTNWRCDGLATVERGVVLGLVEERRSSLANGAIERLYNQFFKPGAHWDDMPTMPKPKCTEPNENLTPEHKEALRKAYPAAYDRAMNPITHTPGSRAAIEEAVNSVEGVEVVDIEEGTTTQSVRIFVKNAIGLGFDHCDRIVDVLSLVMPVHIAWSIWPM